MRVWSDPYILKLLAKASEEEPLIAKLRRTVLVGGLSGSSGPVTFKLTSEGTIVGERSSPKNPSTPAQVAARTRLTTATRTFQGFTQAQEDAWNNYAKFTQKNDDTTQQKKMLSGIDAYVRLATKFMQANNGGTPPSSPPTSPFSGDTIVITASASTGTITFTASGANAAGVKTELLLQPLAGRLRNPSAKAYRSKAFVAFASPGQEFDVDVPPGWYAAAYRFVKTATGQTSNLVPIGVSQVSLAVSQGTSKKKAA